MELGLVGKVIFITGGGSGIGKAAALAFAREGARVVVAGRTERRLQNACDEAAAQGLSLASYPLDVRDNAALQQAADDTCARFGRLDVWVNNAGVAISKPFEEFTDEEWRTVLDVNLGAVFFGSRAAARHMKRQNGGVILNASSYAVRIPHAGGAPYAAAKSGVSSLTKTLAAELAPWNIRVVGYIPGMIVTEMSAETVRQRESELTDCVSLRRLGTPEDMAGPIVFAASDACGYLTGVDIEVTGGKYCVQNTGFAWDALGKGPF